MELFTLREVCEMVGVSRRAVQGYEKLNMVSAVERNKYGYLLYDEASVALIREIKLYRDMGFSVKEVKDLLISTEENRKEKIVKRIQALYKEMDRLKENIRLAEEMLR